MGLTADERGGGPLAGRCVAQTDHSSLLSFRFPQCVLLRSGLNSRTTCRFSARMTPIRANIVGLRFSAARINISIAICHRSAS
jgi:hypothetical protein